MPSPGVLTSGKRQTSSTQRKFSTIYLETFWKLTDYLEIYWKIYFIYCCYHNHWSESIFFQVPISNLPLCIYNYMSFLPAVWKPQIVTELVLCWRMCTLTTQQLQRTWPAQLQALCKTMVGEGTPSTTLEKQTHRHIQNRLMKITQPERELAHKTLQSSLLLYCFIT